MSHTHDHHHDHDHHDHGGEEIDPTEAPTSRLAVLGSPIAHSKSPLIHRAAYAQMGLAWSYDRDELVADELAGYLGARTSGWRGFSLTMPLKEEARRLSAILDPVAEESGVVNTLLRLDSETHPWAGFNTDVGGLAAAIRKAGLDVTSTLVIGSGATAVSAIMAARSLGAEHIEISARNTEAAGVLVTRFGGTAGGETARALTVSAASLLTREYLEKFGDPGIEHWDREPTLVISTLPGPAAAELVIPDSLTAVPLFDVAYDPWPSPLADRWRASGGDAHPGTAMLVEQALLQIRIFMNGDPGAPLEAEERVLAAMYDAV